MIVYESPSVVPYKLIDYFDEGEIHHIGDPVCDPVEEPECESYFAGSQNGVLTKKFLYVRDHLGSVVQMIDLKPSVGGTVVREFDYDPWGVQEEVTAAVYAPEATIGFTGH